MKQTLDALHDFFSQFGLPVYAGDNIPDNVKMPYITCDLVEPEPLATALFNASVWYRNTDFITVAAKVDEIKAAIGNGASLKTESGVIHIFRERSGAFCQMRNDPNRETKRAYLSMLIHCNTD